MSNVTARFPTLKAHVRDALKKVEGYWYPGVVASDEEYGVLGEDYCFEFVAKGDDFDNKSKRFLVTVKDYLLIPEVAVEELYFDVSRPYLGYAVELSKIDIMLTDIIKMSKGKMSRESFHDAHNIK